MGFFPTDANDQDEIGPNVNGTYFKYIAADDKWIIISNLEISDSIYDEGDWDGNPDGATKNVIRDKIESMSTPDHNNLNGLNDGDSYEHITATEKGKIHDQNHDNTYHSTNYHTESDGSGVVTVHSDMVSVGSGSIITTNERNALHPQLTNLTELSTRNHNDLLNIDAGDIKHITATQLGNLHSIYTLESHNNTYHSTNYEVANANIQSHVSSPVTDAHHTKYLSTTAHAYVEATALTLTQTLTVRDILLTDTYGIVIDAVVADDNYNGIILSIDTAGCNPGDFVYIDGADSVAIADADDFTKMPVIGVCVGAGRVLTHGTYRNLGDYALTAGQTVYMSTTAGVPTWTPPLGSGNIVQILGVATDLDCIFVNVSLDWVEIV